MKQVAQNILNDVDIQIDGGRPWDIQVKNPDLYKRVMSGWSLALGESYMDGWWDVEALDQFFDKIIQARLNAKFKISRQVIWNAVKAKATNLQNKSRAGISIGHHYDIGNDLYELMLDKRMNYSCGYWKNAQTLDEAQVAKLDLICQKLKLEPGQTLLDIGCGWGGLAQFAAEKYGVKVVGITISKEQAKSARERVAGLDIDIRLQDYRDLNEQFDRIVSVGMFEHVGQKNYREFMEVANRNLKDEGLFLLHTIGGNKSVRSIESWMNKYIFPNAMLPSARQITTAYEKIFRLDDWHSFGTYYDKTLMAWHENFNAHWDQLKDQYDERFRRMWNYYLLSSASSFRSHLNQVWQIVFSKVGSQVIYESIR